MPSSYDPDWLNKMKRCQEEDALVSSAISPGYEPSHSGPIQEPSWNDYEGRVTVQGSKIVIPRAMRQEVI